MRKRIKCKAEKVGQGESQVSEGGRRKEESRRRKAEGRIVGKVGKKGKGRRCER